MPNYHRYYRPAPVFVTLVTHGRRSWLVERAAQVSASMHRARDKHPFRHHAHVLLPDHLHWLFEPADTNFSAVVAAFKRDLTWALKADGVAGPLWQKRFFDHIIRDDDDFHRHLDYIHYNPVKHGHCASPRDWPHSSFQAWCERGAYAGDWGSSEPAGLAGMGLE